MTDPQFERYHRHILLPQFGAKGQRRLLGSRVMMVGVGGLGSPLSMYLAASGIGHLVLIDFDRVELSNLQRQVLFTTADIGRNKVDAAKEHLQALNPDIRIDVFPRVLEKGELLEEAARADVVVDASDNFATRFELNAVCVETRTPLVSGAASRMEAQISVFHPGMAASPCYHCLYANASGEGETCSQTGVFAPLLGIAGSVQATEVIKLLLNLGEPLIGRVLLLDALHMEWRILKLRKDPHCPVCSQ